jgi:small subunit ribosomal protein S11
MAEEKKDVEETAAAEAAPAETEAASAEVAPVVAEEKPAEVAPVEEKAEAAPVVAEEKPAKAAPVKEKAKVAPVEEKAKAAPAGEKAKAAPAGEKAKAAPAGEKAKAAPAGEKAKAAPAGEKAKAAPAGEKAKAAPAEGKGATEEGDDENRPKLATAAELLADAKVEPVKRRKGAKNVPFGIAFVKTTFNNTIVSFTDMRGNVIAWSSAGRCNFKGSRKSTAFAATTVAQEASRGAISHGMTEVEVRVQGPGAGRESAVRAIQSAGLSISVIKDTTAIPHNGCRPPKRRRV